MYILRMFNNGKAARRDTGGPPLGINVIPKRSDLIKHTITALCDIVVGAPARRR